MPSYGKRAASQPFPKKDLCFFCEQFRRKIFEEPFSSPPPFQPANWTNTAMTGGGITSVGRVFVCGRL